MITVICGSDAMYFPLQFYLFIHFISFYFIVYNVFVMFLIWIRSFLAVSCRMEGVSDSGSLITMW